MASVEIAIRRLESRDAPVMAAAFEAIGWPKPESQFARYTAEQSSGERDCWVAEVGGVFAGYVTLVWRPNYPPLLAARLPEIQDLNVLERFRRQGVGATLVDAAEAEAATRVDEVGIGVGLHPDTAPPSGCTCSAGTCPTPMG